MEEVISSRLLEEMIEERKGKKIWGSSKVFKYSTIRKESVKARYNLELCERLPRRGDLTTQDSWLRFKGKYLRGTLSDTVKVGDTEEFGE